MVWRSRQALNGLTRSILLLLALLIVRRLDDAFGILDGTATAILSSAVVALIAVDLHYIYRQRGLFAMYQRNRLERIAQLEKMRQQNETKLARKRWDDDSVQRYL